MLGDRSGPSRPAARSRFFRRAPRRCEGQERPPSGQGSAGYATVLEKPTAADRHDTSEVEWPERSQGLASGPIGMPDAPVETGAEQDHKAGQHGPRAHNILRVARVTCRRWRRLFAFEQVEVTMHCPLLPWVLPQASATRMKGP